MYCTHFISFIFKKKERERKREKLSFCWPKFLGGKTSIVALLQASLHQEKDKLLLGLIFPNLRR
jgi:hypothetical protein